MNLREVVRSIVREVVGTDLRPLIRKVLMEELSDPSRSDETADEETVEPVEPVETEVNPRSAAALKAARTRADKKTAHPQGSKKARELGIAIGQKWRGKKYLSLIKDRTIKIHRMDAVGIYPEILSSGKKHCQAKRITFRSLLSRYDRIE